MSRNILLTAAAARPRSRSLFPRQASPLARARLAAMLVAVLVLAALLTLTACGGGGEEEATATTPADETSTQAPTVEQPTATPEETTPEAAESPAVRIDWCDLVTAEEADEALGEFVTGILSVGHGNCLWHTDSVIYLRIEQGSADDLQADAEMEGVAGEPVPGIGEEAAWFDGVRLPSHHIDFEGTTVALGVLSVRQGDAYLRIMLNLPEADSSTQLEIAKGLAAKAIERIP